MDESGWGVAELFDAGFYLWQRPDVRDAGVDPLAHYAVHGWREGADPHPLFHPRCYMSQVPDIEVEPFAHYLAEGWRAGFSPHPLFDPAHYAAQAGHAAMPPLAHYAVSGQLAGFSPYPLLGIAAPPGDEPADRARQYLMGGWAVGLSPHPLFDAPDYLRQRPDLGSDYEPLQHYLAHGWHEGSRPHALFDPIHYRTQVPHPGMADLLHYILHGEAAGLRPNALFDPFYYKAVNARHLGGEASPLLHYIRAGEALGLPTAPEFRPRRYASRRPWSMPGDALRHALLHGIPADEAPPAWPPLARPPAAPVPFVLMLLGSGGEGRAAMLAALDGVPVMAAADPALLAALPMPEGLPAVLPAVLVDGDAFLALADLHRLAAAAPAHPAVLDRAGDVLHAGYVVRDGIATPRGIGWDPAHPDLSHAAPGLGIGGPGTSGLATFGPAASAPLEDALRACRAGGSAADVFGRLRGRFLPAARAVLPEAAHGRGAPSLVPHAGEATPERPRMLLIDSIVPRAGNDGGSSYVLGLLDTYVECGFDATLLPDGELSAPGWALQPLQDHGIRVVQAPFAASSEEYIASTLDEYAIVVMSRVACGGRHLEALRARWPAARLVFHPIDLYHLRETREAVLHGSVEGFATAMRTKARELHVACHADLTVVVSEHEQDVLRGAGADAAWIEPEHKARTPAPYRPGARTGVLFVGSYRHAPNVDAVHWLCGHIWPLVAARRPDIPLLVAGSDMPDALHAYAGRSVSMLGHVPDLDSLLDSVRLTVAPLRYGAGVKLKLVCSLAAGVPAVCTAIAAEGTGLLPGQGTVLAESADAFASAVVALYDDMDRLHALSDAGGQAMWERFSSHSVRARYWAALGLAPPGA